MATVSKNDPQTGTPQTSQPTDRDRRASHVEPTPAEVAAEASAIYPDTSDAPPTADEIAAEAYAIYQSRGAEHGRDQDDWLEAERRLTDRRRRR